MQKICKNALSYILVIFSVGITLVIYFFGRDFYQYLEHPVDTWAYVLTAVATLMLACISYWQINKLTKDSATQVLVHINERWSSAEILEARITFQQILLQHKNPGKRNKAIKKRLFSGTKEGTYLLNLLDLLEVMGFFVSSGRIDKEDLAGTYGGMITLLYQCVAQTIKELRDVRNDNTIYVHFEDLAKSILESEGKNKDQPHA